MHDTSREFGRLFLHHFWQPGMYRVLDIGSRNVNGTLREFYPAGVQWCGVDIEPGPGVDVVVPDGRFVSNLLGLGYGRGAFDLIVSSSCFEHAKHPWELLNDAAYLLRDAGFIYVNAPSNGPVHNHPFDCWRFYPDAGLALAEWAGLHLVESFIGPRGQDGWEDAVMIFAKEKVEPPVYLSDLVAGCRYVRRGG